MKVSTDDIKSAMEKLAAQINVPRHLLPTFGYTFESHPYIDVNENGELCYEIKERGETLVREYAPDPDHLLYIIFRDITKEMALKANAVNSDQSQKDNRRRRDEWQLQLLEKLNKAWMEKERERQGSNAFYFPYQDNEGQREAYIRELMGNGFLREEAEKKAYARFP